MHRQRDGHAGSVGSGRHRPDRHRLREVVGGHADSSRERAAHRASAGAPASAGARRQPAAPTAATCKGDGSKGTVKMMINQWVGAAANVAVAQCLLQQMGYKVETSTLAEEVAWQGFDTGEVDVILENWGHPDLEKKYITDTKKATDAGPNGVNGIIGWYVPGWMVDTYPDITDCKNLNKYADLFKTSESGDKGQFLGSDPTFVQYDEALITNLGLNFKDIFSGSEAASITAFQAGRQEQDPAHRLLLRPAVAPERDQARPGQAAAVDRGLRRGPEEGRLRLPGLHAEQDRPDRVAEQRRRRRDVHQELPVGQRRPERGGRRDHEQEHEPRGRSQGVDRRQRRDLAGVDALTQWRRLHVARHAAGGRAAGRSQFSRTGPDVGG